MGNRRIGRKRLYGVEKQGQSVDLGAGAGISGAISRATQHRQGSEIITEILIDLGCADAAGDIQGGGADKPVGVASAAAAITRLTTAKYGIITEFRVVCLEDGGADYDLVVGSASQNTAATVTGRVEMVADIGNDLGEDTSSTNSAVIGVDSGGMQTADSEWYLYLTNAAANSNAVDIDSGKLAIYIHGFEAPSDI
jgi:hypothetical protein